MKLLASKFNEKKIFSDLSCTHGRTCVYGRYAPDYSVLYSIYCKPNAKYAGHVLERLLISPLTLKNSVTDPVRLILGD